MKNTFFCKTIRSVKKIIILLFLTQVCNGQPWLYDFGTGTGTFDSAGKASIIFLPAPYHPGDTVRVRIGTGGGSFNLNNPGILNFGAASELKGIASSSLSVNKFSLFKYPQGKSFYIKYSIRLDGGTSGKWLFFMGKGATFSDNLSFTTNQVFAGLQWTFTNTNGGISTCNRNGFNWDTIHPSPFSQSTNNKVEIYGNNNSTGTINYSYNDCSSQSVAPGKWDLWVNGSLVGNDLPRAALPADSNINAFMFYGISSTGNVANIFLDDILYLNNIPASVYEPPQQPSNIIFSNVTGSGFNVSLTPANGNPDGYIVIRKTGSAPTSTPTDYTSYTTGTTIGDGVVAFAGQATTFSENSLNPLTTYFYKIFSYNGTSTCINYNTISPLQGTQTTSSINFYSKSTGNLEVTTNWGSNNNGSGTVPANFTDNGQYFYIKNRSSATIGAAWTVSGNNSKVIIGNDTSNIEFVIPFSYIFTGNIDVTNNGKLTIQNTTAPNIGTTVSGSTIEYSASVTQNILSHVYYNLRIAGSGNKMIPANVSVNGTLTLSGTVLLTLADDLTVNHATINSGTFEIPVNKTMTVSDTLTNIAGINGIIIRSDNNGTGSLINSTTGVNAKAERFAAVSSVPKYHYFSSAISNAKASSILDTTLGDYNCYAYEPSIPGNIDKKWYRVYPNNTMQTGKGYTVPYKSSVCSSKTILFTGILNTGNVSTGISSVASDWNLIGNPYPCAISAADFIAENCTGNPRLNGTLYFWDDDASGGSGYTPADYATWNGTGSASNGQIPNGYIGTSQAFFVQSQGGYSTINFTNSMKRSNNVQFFIPDPSTILKFKISITDSKNNYNEILIGFLPTATDGFDPLYDGVKLKGNPDLALYSMMKDDTNEYVIQGLPPFTEKRIVPLGIDANLGGFYKFRLNSVENHTNEKVFLKDILENKIINLAIDSQYQFNSKAGTIKDRFELIFSPDIINSDNKSNPRSTLKIYSFGKSVYINNTANKPQQGIINVYNILGKKILSKNLSETNPDNIFQINGSTGYYIITIKTNDVFTREKVYIQ